MNEEEDNKMKNKILFIISIIAVLMLSIGISEAVEAPAINISFMNQDPDPVAPGRYVELRFKIFNNMTK